MNFHPLSLNGAKGDTADKVFLEGRNGEKDRQSAKHRHGGYFRPKCRLSPKKLANLNRIGDYLCAREHQSKQELVP